jgi:hypothetical protein
MPQKSKIPEQDLSSPFFVSTSSHSTGTMKHVIILIVEIV